MYKPFNNVRNELIKIVDLDLVTPRGKGMGRWRVEWGAAPQAENASKLLETRGEACSMAASQTSEGASSRANILITGLLDCEVRCLCCS